MKFTTLFFQPYAISGNFLQQLHFSILIMVQILFKILLGAQLFW